MGHEVQDEDPAWASSLRSVVPVPAPLPRRPRPHGSNVLSLASLSGEKHARVFLATLNILSFRFDL